MTVSDLLWWSTQKIVWYVSNTDNTVAVTKASVHPILIGGDQLTAARARGALRAKANEDKPSLRLEGFIPVAEDWHAKVMESLLLLEFTMRFN